MCGYVWIITVIVSNEDIFFPQHISYYAKLL